MTRQILLLRSICAILFVGWTVILPQAGSQLIATDGSQLPLRPLAGGDRKCNLNCTRKRKRLVCGSDGRTYTSRCQIRKANCEGHAVTVKYRGKCPEATRCRSERTYAQKLARTPMVGIFIPECNSDGSYAEVQCHASTGYCWCVNNIGKPISGSSVQYKQPNCAQIDKSTNRRRSSRGRKQKRDCSSTDRPTFTRNLIKIFRSEYLRMPITLTERVSSDVSLDTMEKRVIEWKFTELDRNKDSKLSRKELRNLRRMVKKIVKPKACAKTFTKYCDLDQNRKITRKEWSVCLWIDMENEQNNTSLERPQGIPLRESPVGGVVTPWKNQEDPKTKGSVATKQDNADTASIGAINKPAPDREKRNCNSQRDLVLAEQQKKKSTSGGVGGDDQYVFVPKCTADGRYNKTQCHKSTGYCWCVNQDTGKPVAGTSTLNKTPQCESTIHNDRTMKGCPASRKRKFLNDLLGELRREMENSTSYSKPPPSSIQQTEQEQVIRWKFTQIDVNVNRLLDRKEWKPFRRALKAEKHLRKCGRSFLRFCDENKDRKITIQEWLDCFNVNEGSNGGVSSTNRRNPFHTYLKSD